MKQKTHRLLSLLLCLVMVLGLLPMTAFAEGTREEVDTIKATAIINVPSYGEPTNYPAFTVTEGSPAYIAAMMTHWEKKNTVTGKWDNVSSGNTFTEGTWRLSVQVRIDGEGGKTHKLSEKPRFFVNEVEWQIESKSRFDDYHFVSLAYFHSQEYEVTSSTLPQMYDITVTNGVAKNESYIDITKAKPGDKVVLLADDRRDEGLAFEKWVVTGATVDAENNMTAKFIMPEGNVTAEATYIPCDISIKAVKLTLGNYAVGKKASDISVKIITPDVVDFSYGDTYRCYDEDGVALGGSYVLCYLEGETIKRLGADELIKEGVEYFLEVHIKSDEGYTFLGLKEENVTLDGTAGGAMFMQPNNAVYSFLLKPLKTVDLTLDNYAVGNKAGDISVEITTPGVLFSGSGEGSGEYNQGYQIAIPDGEGIGGTITVRFLEPDEKLEAGSDYDLFVFVKAADGSTLKDLTAANAKLDGKAAEAVDLLFDGVTAVIIFKLTPLEASHTHNLTLVPASSATCTTPGNTAYYTCDGCDKWFEDATGASEITDKTSVILAATGHTPSNWKSDADNHWKECTVVGCGVIIEGSKAAHTPDREAATETEPVKCSECDYEIAPVLGMQDYILEMPVSIAVKLTGDKKPAKETFKFEIYDLGYEDAAFEIVNDTVVLENLEFDENGVAFADGIIKIKVTGEEQLSNLTEGFKVRMVKGTAKGWTYAAEQWYVKPVVYEGLADAAFNIGYDVREIVDGEISEIPANNMNFTVGYEAVTEPGTPQTGDNSVMGLWIAWPVVSGAGATAIYSRKRKSSAE